MREKNAGRILILVLIAVLFLSLGSRIYLKTDTEDGTGENRELSKWPSLTGTDYGNYTADLTAYFNDHMPFRNPLITLHSMLNYCCFGRSANESVIPGREGWLFYSRADDGDSLACYQGTNLYTEGELRKLAENCVAVRDHLAAEGREFVLCIIPNKERIYSEYMPEQYGNPAEAYRALQVVEYLRTNTDLRVVYPYDVLMEAKEKLDAELWYRTDTHWNTVGGYIGAGALLEALGIRLPVLWDPSIQIHVEEAAHPGDLSGMLHLNGLTSMKAPEYTVAGYPAFPVETLKWDFQEVFQYHAEGADPRRLYVIRDSFATAMAPYIAGQFQDSWIRYMVTYTYEDLLAFDPDIVVYEVVERNLYMLETFSVK